MEHVGFQIIFDRTLRGAMAPFMHQELLDGIDWLRDEFYLELRLRLTADDDGMPVLDKEVAFKTCDACGVRATVECVYCEADACDSCIPICEHDVREVKDKP